MLAHVTETQAPIIPHEQRWFTMPSGEIPSCSEPRISASRWTGTAVDRCEQEAEIEADRHVLGITLRTMDEFTVFAARKSIHSGRLPQGSMRLNEPGTALRGIFQGAYDVLH